MKSIPSRMDCNFLQQLYETQCQKEYKPVTDHRILPLVQEMHMLNCLKTIELGLQLCKKKLMEPTSPLKGQD